MKSRRDTVVLTQIVFGPLLAGAYCGARYFLREFPLKTGERSMSWTAFIYGDFALWRGEVRFWREYLRSRWSVAGQSARGEVVQYGPVIVFRSRNVYSPKKVGFRPTVVFLVTMRGGTVG